MSLSKGPFEGLKVVDLATYAAGPLACQILGYWGAEVVKIESLQGDPGRMFAHLMQVPCTDDEEPIAQTVNAFKRVMSVDLKKQAGMRILHRLLESADVLVTNYRPKALKNLGLTYEDLNERYPRLIYGFISGYGEKGPVADKPGFDMISYFARGGLMAELGEPDAGPLPPIAAVGDFTTGTNLAMGIASALYERERTGKGQKVVASLYHAALWVMNTMITVRNYWPYPKASIYNPVYALTNCYQCKDGKWIALCIMEHHRFWKPLCATMGLDEFADDPRFDNIVVAIMNTKELYPIIRDRILTKDREEWAKIWTEADITFEEILSHQDILKDEQALENNFLIPVVMQNEKKIMMPSPPVQFSSYGVPEWKLAPRMGEHTKEVLNELNYTDDEIMVLESSKHIFVRKNN